MPEVNADNLDAIIERIASDEGGSSFLALLSDSEDAFIIEQETGIPALLTFTCEAIYNALPEDVRKQFAIDMIEAVHFYAVADTSLVPWQLLQWNIDSLPEGDVHEAVTLRANGVALREMTEGIGSEKRQVMNAGYIAFMAQDEPVAFHAAKAVCDMETSEAVAAERSSHDRDMLRSAAGHIADSLQAGPFTAEEQAEKIVELIGEA